MFSNRWIGRNWT